MNPKLTQELHKEYPHGHPDFIPITLDEITLHSTKNFKYAYKGNPLGNFNRVAEIMKLYPQIDWATPLGVCLMYSLKQLDATFWMMNSGHSVDALEGIDGCLTDVSVYAKLGRIIAKQ